MSTSPSSTIRPHAKRCSIAPKRACAIWLWLVFTTLLQANVSLTWQDNSDNETGFEIERSINGGPFERIASVPGDSATFTDSRVNEGDLYQYRVRAYNQFGKSGYTNVAPIEIPGPISFEDWIARMLLGGSFPSGIEAPDQSLADTDLPNLLCYVHGINPFNPNRSYLAKTRTVTIDGHPTRVIDRALFKYSIDVNTKLLESKDLNTWQEVEYESFYTRESSYHNWERIILPDQSRSKFYRIELSLQYQTKS
ncbi:fibronectin type III domain-containing protein [Pelagicoccus mobilis]|uniref:Fibronectin type III domain-containing protein n=1 Tax=Pelagicoccus mobilis TaxID=415221 RepID=A0A934RSJ6_9BACT|nr:fibronectin type III domain-containing protein [Pelagicoccus mobilis]MBK1876790.1 fibronectin type III domain-containing protein [Pelagicoccus mobilis]